MSIFCMKTINNLFPCKHKASPLALLLLAWVMLLSAMPAWADDIGKYELKVVAKPTKAGSFNTNKDSLSAGQMVELYAYANSNFSFKEWVDEQGKVVSDKQNFQYNMPAHNVTLTAIYTFDPANPSNPNKNFWDRTTGNVIADDFKAGSLQSAISQAIGSGNASKVLAITVAGRINSNDFGIANTYSNCTTLDLSRTTGVSEVPSYAFDYTKLQAVMLPTTIDKIGYEAFYRCSQLSSLTCYAMTPPTVGGYAFYGVQEDMVVFVPAAAVAQYQEAAGWKGFTILPIQNDIRTIKVSLPQDANIADYANMYLELTNTKSGQRLHYVMTDKREYAFANIIKNTAWNVTLRNERGDVFGEIRNVEVKDEDAAVTFDKLKKPQHISLKVLTPKGNDVTAQTSITWTTVNGEYLAQGNEMNGISEGSKMAYNIALSQSLAMLYNTPSEGIHVAKQDSNNIICHLNTLSQIIIKGNVKDATTGMAISNATVSASQTFGGKYGKTIGTQTDEKGNYTFTAFKVPTTLTIASTDYISKVLSCDSLMALNADTITAQQVLLRPIEGATIALDFNYRTCADSTDDVVQNWYSDYNNIAYAIYNKTKQCAINNFSVQYPRIVLLDEVSVGDVLSIEASSKTNDFMPISLTTKVDSTMLATASFEIVEKGQIRASFAQNDNEQVVGSLYDADGKLIKTADYNNASLTFTNLSDGNYTLVTMGKSTLFNTIYDLNQFSNTGLAEGTDYVVNNLIVKSGEITTLNIDNVPTLNESKLYYTGDNTLFAVNKPSIVVGNYLTLSAQLDFKQAYAKDVSNVNIVVDLPTSCQFVENSVMVGNSVSTYTCNGSRITIPVSNYTDRVRFCIMPTLSGSYSPSAFVQFDINGKKVSQPIGCANYIVQDLSISVPSTVAKTNIPISGTAIGKSTIEIYDDDILIGNTTSLSNGTWETTCNLHEPYNLSTHYIHAKVTTKAGLELISETKKVKYDANMIVPEKVTMLYYNPEYVGQYNIVFDLINRTVSPKTYYFFPYKSYPNWRGSGTEPKDFTFIADLSNNDSTAVNKVTIGVYTSNNKWINLNASYSEKFNRWVATGRFSSKSLPIGVKVDITAQTHSAIDAEYINAALTNMPNTIEDLRAYNDSIKRSVSELTTILHKEDISEEECLKSINEHLLAMGIEPITKTDTTYTDEKINQLINRADTVLKSNIISQLDSIINIDIYNSKELSAYLNGIEIHKVENVTEKELLAQGYVAFDKTDSTKVFILSENNHYEIVDLSIGIKITFAGESNLLANCLSNKNSFATQMKQVADEIKEKCDKLKSIFSAFNDAINSVTETLEASNKVLKKEIRDLLQCADYLKYNGKNPLSKLEVYAKLNVVCAAKKANTKILEWMSKNLKAFKVGKTASKAFGIFSVLSDLYDGVTSVNKTIELHNKCMPCDNDEVHAKSIQESIAKLGTQTGAFYIGQLALDITSFISAEAGIFAAVPSSGTSLAAVGISVGVVAANFAACQLFSKHFDEQIAIYEYMISTLKCKRNNTDGNNGDNGDNGDNDGNNRNNQSPEPTITPFQDPSGYVYESVLSNRLEGVKATVYYKEMVEDMYGDLHENIVKWNAEEYAQKNPLFTDENGFYRWDVPQGLWQVKFEKEGYETTYSDWLPVPPPQLDVNIGMKQNVQPNVKDAKAYEDAVELTFDKYMMAELLNTDNIMVIDKASNRMVSGHIELLNEEADYNDKSKLYASKLRFVADKPFENIKDFNVSAVTLIVKNQVKSYAGIRMENDYLQSFVASKEIKRIECDSAMSIEYGKSSTIDIAVLPAAAAAGKEVEVKLSSNLIISANTTKCTLDEEGHAQIVVNGELPGIAVITFKLADKELSATTIISVKEVQKQPVSAPTANIATGSMVEKGTAITLQCSTEGALIYYTLDGSCPCDNTTARKLYDGTPILINADTEIKAMAYMDGEESEVVTFFYKVLTPDNVSNASAKGIKVYPTLVKDILNVDISEGTKGYLFITDTNGRQILNIDNAKSHNTINMTGLTSGMYVVVVRTEDGKCTTKIIKL